MSQANAKLWNRYFADARAERRLLKGMPRRDRQTFWSLLRNGKPSQAADMLMARM